jgi:cytochrome c oxidase assembly factor CtaG
MHAAVNYLGERQRGLVPHLPNLRLKHASFFGTGLLFWWVHLHSVGARRAAGIGHLLATSVHMELLGTFSSSPHVLGSKFQNPGAAAWGLTDVEDQ